MIRSGDSQCSSAISGSDSARSARRRPCRSARCSSHASSRICCGHSRAARLRTARGPSWRDVDDAAELVSYPYHTACSRSACGVSRLPARTSSASAARGRPAVTLGTLVVSHWVLDYLTHGPTCRSRSWDPSDWGSVCGIRRRHARRIECADLLDRLAVVSARQRRPRDRVGSIGLWVPGRLSSDRRYLASTFGPPPPTRRRGRLVGAGDVADRHLGILGRQTPGSAAWLRVSDEA